MELTQDVQMKALQETKDVLAKSYGYHDWKDFIDLLRKSAPADKLFIMDGMVDKVAKHYAEEVLKVAAEKATMTIEKEGVFIAEKQIGWIANDGDHIEINKQSILNLIKELK